MQFGTQQIYFFVVLIMHSSSRIDMDTEKNQKKNHPPWESGRELLLLLLLLLFCFVVQIEYVVNQRNKVGGRSGCD
jgi:hypothetical protein